MYILKSKKTGVECGWSINLWKTGAFEIVENGDGLPTPAKVYAGIEKATGLNLLTSPPRPAAVVPDPLAQPEPAGILTPAPVAPVTTVEDAPPAAPVSAVTAAPAPDTLPADVFAGAVAVDAEDNS